MYLVLETIKSSPQEFSNTWKCILFKLSKSRFNRYWLWSWRNKKKNPIINYFQIDHYVSWNARYIVISLYDYIPWTLNWFPLLKHDPSSILLLFSYKKVSVKVHRGSTSQCNLGSLLSCLPHCIKKILLPVCAVSDQPCPKPILSHMILDLVHRTTI